MAETGVKFYDLPLEERRRWVAEQAGIPLSEVEMLSGLPGLTPEQADHMIENVIGVYGLPLGIARYFRVNGRDVLVPMALEEPSVVASASFMAKLAFQGGDLFATSSSPEPFSPRPRGMRGEGRPFPFAPSPAAPSSFWEWGRKLKTWNPSARSDWPGAQIAAR